MSAAVVVLVVGSDRAVLDALADEIPELVLGLVKVEAVRGIADAVAVTQSVRAKGGVVPMAFVDIDIDTDGESGVDLLVALHENEHLESTRLVLVTSKASLHGVDAALQHGAVHGMITQPWTPLGLGRLLKAHLATYLLEHSPQLLEIFDELLDDDERDRARTRIEQRRSAKHHPRDSPHPLLDSSMLDAEVEAQMVRLLDRALGHPPRIRVGPGTVLIEAGEDVGGIYVLLDGVIRLTSRTDTGELILHEDSTGAIVGLLSLATHRRAMLQCHAVTDVRAIPVTIDQLARALEAEPELSSLLTRVLIGSLARRLRRSDELQVELDQSLAALSEARAQLVASAKFTTLGEISAGMAHELNNPTAALVRAMAHLTDELEAVVDDPTIATAVRNQSDTPVVPTATRRAQRRELANELEDHHLAGRLVDIGITDPADARAMAGMEPAAFNRLEAAVRLGQTIRNATSAAARIQSLVGSLRAYARGDDGRGPLVAGVGVAKGIDDALLLVGHRLGAVEVERDFGPVPDITARPGALQQVWTNLIGNALDAIHDRGRLTLRVSATDHDRVKVEVIDDGPGVPANLQSRIFEPRFTTKDGRVQFGLGLGLSISRQIVQEHNGAIRLESEPGHTMFTVELPVGGTL